MRSELFVVRNVIFVVNTDVLFCLCLIAVVTFISRCRPVEQVAHGCYMYSFCHGCAICFLFHCSGPLLILLLLSLFVRRSCGWCSHHAATHQSFYPACWRWLQPHAGHASSRLPFLVFKPLTSRPVRFGQPANMLAISVTLDVLNFVVAHHHTKHRRPPL